MEEKVKLYDKKDIKTNKQKGDKVTEIYVVKELKGNIKRVTTYYEYCGFMSKKGEKLDRLVDINDGDDLQFMKTLKEEIVPNEKAPIKMEEINTSIIYRSEDRRKGIMFFDEVDAYNLFLNIDKTIIDVKNNSVSKVLKRY